MRWKNVFQCELNPFCQRVLAYYYPKAKSCEDIKKTDFRPHREKIDIFAGGFPTTITAWRGNGSAENDDRRLWPDILRAVREIRLTWVVAENVLGIVNCHGSAKQIFFI
ncbi:DNA cytosine methyltransferase [Pedobacter chinensis]